MNPFISRQAKGCLGRTFVAAALVMLFSPDVRALDKSGASPSKISLPSGPGSIDGLGESFEAQLNTGTFTYSVPIELPEIRGSASPSLALSYNSGNGNGPCGMGWKLEVPRLQRQTDKGLPQYVAGDTITDSTGEELVKLADGTYRSENEGKSVRFEWRNDDSWIARMPDGSVMILGGTPDSRLAGADGTFSWQISSLSDTNGNRTSYTYLQDAGQIYLATVTTGSHSTLASETFVVTFAHEAGRPDPIVDYRPGFRSETRLRLSGITISHGLRRLAQYRLGYDATASTSLLESVTLFGDDRAETGGGAQVNRDFLPPHHFTYSRPTFARNPRMVTMANAPPYSFEANQMEFTDCDADSLPDLLIYDTSQQKYLTALNKGEGNAWGVPQLVQNSPNAPLNTPGTQLADLRGDGRSCLLVQNDTSFTFRNFETATLFSNPVPFAIPSGFYFSNANIRLIDINNDKAMDLMYTDGFGSGHFDFLINRQASGQTNHVLPNPPAAPAGGISFSNGWQLADINGDRLTDLVKARTQEQGGCVFHYSQGWGRFSPQQTIANGPRETDIGSRGLAGLTFLDVDQDGWTDCVYVAYEVVKIWLNQGGTSFAPPVTISGTQIPPYQEGVTGVRFADMNGNSSTDIVWNRTDGGAANRLRYLELSSGTKPHLMTSATNELGGSVTVEYRSSADLMVEAAGTSSPWTSTTPVSIPIVSALTESDGRNHSYRSEFTYRNPFYDGVEKEFRGFASATRTEIGDASQGAPSLLTAMEFHTGNPQAIPPETEALKGKPRSVERRDDATGAVFTRVTHRWVPRQLSLALDPAESRRVTLAYEDFEETTILEKGPAAQAVVLQREFNVDDYGNTILTADYGRVEGTNRSAWDDERITVSTYSASYPGGIAAWLLDATVQTEVQDENGVVISRSQNFYDDPTFSGHNLGSISKGNLTLERRWSDIAGNKYLSASRSVFDGYGNVTGIYDPLGTPGNPTPGHFRNFVYDTKIHTYPETETVHTGNPAMPTLTATATYDAGLGVLRTFRDFNGHTTTLKYDAFGRLTDMIRPGDTDAAPTATYSYQLSQPHSSGILNHIESRRRETAGGGTIDSRDYFDGLGRKLQSRSESERDGQAVVSGATEFNQMKSPWKSYLPYFSTGGLDFSAIPSSTTFTETTYDAIGRALRTYQPPDPQADTRAFSENTYEPLALLLKDEEQTKSTSPHHGAASRQIFDGLKSAGGKSRLREVQEIVKISDTGNVTGAPATWRTQYGYDLLDNLVQITDSQNNVKTLTYDALSRMSGMDDPDAGLLSLLYDDASNLKQSTDANGQVIEYGYDGANRPVTEDYLDAANLAPDVRYTYDVPVSGLDQGDGTSGTAENTRGRLAFVQDLSGEEHLSYDSRGRTVSEVKRFPDPGQRFLVSYRTQSAFDSADRLTRLTYPDGDFVGYLYNARSLLDKITGGSSGHLISGISYRASGQEETVSYGNGVTTVRSYDPRLRLSTLKTTAPGNTRTYLDYNYQLDEASNITHIEDQRDLTGQADAAARQNTQSFLYDDLYRLTRSAWPGARAGQPGKIDYRYDRIGNMLGQTSDIAHMEHGKPVANLGIMTTGADLGAWGRGGRGDSPAGPHALTAVTPVPSPAGATTRSYAYDRKGSMTRIDDLTCGYDFKDRLTTAENDRMRAEYRYDHTDRRVSKKITPKTADAAVPAEPTSTLYINRYFEIRDHESPVKYVWQGNTRLARASGGIDPTVQPLQWLHLQPGWNLVSLSTSSESRNQLLNDSRLTAIAYWDAPVSAWKKLTGSSSPPAAFVAWIHSTVSAVISVRGPPYVAAATLPTRPQFLPILGREAINLAKTFPPDAELWSWNPAVPRWDVRPSVPTATDLFAGSAPSSAAPNTALYLATTAGGNLTLNLPPPALSLRYYHGDHLGTTNVTTDASGGLVEESTAYPFGHPRNEFQPHGTNEPYGFTQKELDEESGLHYFEARYLIATVGRFNRVDSYFLTHENWSESQLENLNLYSYCRASPVSHRDPSGQTTMRALSSETENVQRRITDGGAPVGHQLQKTGKLRQEYTTKAQKLDKTDTSAREALKSEYRAKQTPLGKALTESFLEKRAREGYTPKLTNASKTNTSFNVKATAMKGIGRGLLVVGVGMEVREVINAAPGERPKVAVQASGRLGGAMAAGTMLGAYCAPAGPYAIIACGLAGGVAGSFMGEAAVNSILKSNEN